MAKQKKDNNDTTNVNMYGGIFIRNIEHVEHLHATPESEEKEDGQLDEPEGFNNVALRGFIKAGMLTEELMPAERFSRGEKAMLAHTIAERLKMDVFWPFFQQRWGVKGMAVAYSKYINTKESSCFKQQLDGIK